MSPIPKILDRDPGRDDALEIILAAFDPRIERSQLPLSQAAG
jgi:inosine-uridine nucleoside N-ribohydrolase